ncbi:unnamed protein product [Cladocopium goreaui]|uniref:Uncharacterized protein n=1 Tax=Cladocopium goreaui TaxID=2562237 RepID=A0A9P1DB62_9DINO|nr:unnamed protein product [Cladocopium goreaui]
MHQSQKLGLPAEVLGQESQRIHTLGWFSGNYEHSWWSCCSLQELPFDLVFEDLRPQVLQTCLDVLGRSFLRSWPGGPQEMEDSLRRGVEESGSGPVAHGLRHSQAQELSGRLAPLVVTQVLVNRIAASAVARPRPPLIGVTRIPPPPQGSRVASKRGPTCL